MIPCIAINGEIISEDKARISPNNPGFLFGEGLFETIRADDGVPFLLTKHLLRLRSGLKYLNIEAPTSLNRADNLITQLLKANRLTKKSSVIKIICSRNPQIGVDAAPKPAASLIITTTELDLKEIKSRQAGIRADIIPWERNCNNPLLALKSLNYLENRYALQMAKRDGFSEGIFLNQKGELCEGTFSNLFLIRGNRLLTPPLTAGILPGITRAFILEKAPAVGIEVCETPLFPDDIETCSGAFITSSLMHLSPLLKLGRNQFDLKKTNALRKILMKFFAPA